MSDAAPLQHVSAEPQRQGTQSADQSGGTYTAALGDAGPQAAAQRRLQAMADSSPRMRQLQSQAASIQSGLGAAQFRSMQSTIQRATPPAATDGSGLPSQLKAGIESLSGMSMDHVKVNFNSDKPAQLQAHAYAQGSEIHVAPGQEKHLPHEAWHVVQQRQGRVKPTIQMKDAVPVNDDAGLESEADVMGARALAAGAAQASAGGQQAVSGQPLATGSQAAGTGMAMQRQSLRVDLSATGSRAAPALSLRPHGGVFQRASMLVLIGSDQDILDLAGNTAAEERDFGARSVKLAAANLGTISEGDSLYLSGAHGNAASYGPYGSGQDLVNALWAKGLRVVKSIVLTGCETGNGFSQDFYDKAIAKGIDIKEYATAPKTYGRTRDGGRLTAETPEGVKVRKLKEEKAKLDIIELAFGTRGNEIQTEIDTIVSQPNYWAEIENPMQLAAEVGEIYDSLDRYHAAYKIDSSPDDGSMSYKVYKAQFDNIKDTYNPRLRKAIEVWATHGKANVREAFLKVYNRVPAERKVWDLSELM